MPCRARPVIPRRLRPTCNLALCYDTTGRLADSVRELEIVVQQQPGNRDMQNQLRASRRRLEAAGGA